MRSARICLFAALGWPFVIGASQTLAMPPALKATTASSTLTVVATGNGSGVVTSSAGAISCGAVCSDSYVNGTQVTLSAAAAPGSQFTG